MNRQAAIFLIFFIKFGLIPVASDQDIRHPFWGSAHDPGDALDGHIFRTFDDQLIMNVSADSLIGEVSHGIAEEVSGDCLHDILYEFRTIGFYAFPFLGGADAFISDRFTAEAILSDTWLHIAEPSTGGKSDEKHATLIAEFDSFDFCRNTLLDGSFYGIVDIPPKGGDVRIGVAPGIY